MTHGGILKLGSGQSLAYSRPIATPTRLSAARQAAEEPIRVDVSVRSAAANNLYTRERLHGNTPGQLLDCYI